MESCLLSNMKAGLSEAFGLLVGYELKHVSGDVSSRWQLLDDWKNVAKHRAAEKGVKSTHALAVGVMSAGLMGATAAPAFAVELNAPAVPEISIDIPELPQLNTALKDAEIPAQVQDTAKDASKEVSKKTLPAAKKVNKTVKPKVDKAREENKPATDKIRKGLKPVTNELKPVKKALQPTTDRLMQDQTVATLVGTIVPVEEVSPAAKAKSKAEIQRARGAKILKAARSRIGDPYVWGASGPNAFDCSGLVMWAHNQLGIKIPRTSQDQINGGRHVARKNLQPAILLLSRQCSHVVFMLA